MNIDEKTPTKSTPAIYKKSTSWVRCIPKYARLIYKFQKLHSVIHCTNKGAKPYDHFTC